MAAIGHRGCVSGWRRREFCRHRDCFDSRWHGRQLQPDTDYGSYIREGWRGLQLDADASRLSRYPNSNGLRSDRRALSSRASPRAGAVRRNLRLPRRSRRRTSNSPRIGRHVPEQSDVQGWYGIELDASTIKPFPIAQQQFSTFGRHVPEQVDVEGWFGIELDYRFAKPLPVVEQRWDAFDRAAVLSLRHRRLAAHS